MSMERDYIRGRNVTRTFCQKSKSVKKIKFKGKNAKRKRERERERQRSGIPARGVNKDPMILMTPQG